jgi:hypothetical protein
MQSFILDSRLKTAQAIQLKSIKPLERLELTSGLSRENRRAHDLIQVSRMTSYEKHTFFELFVFNHFIPNAALIGTLIVSFNI